MVEITIYPTKKAGKFISSLNGKVNIDISPVRIWAGASETNKDNAPFRVLQNGEVHATKGHFEGTFSGEVNVGNIKIFDTNASDSYIQLMNNTDTAVLGQISGEKDTFFSNNFYILDPESRLKIFEIANPSYVDSRININAKTTFYGDDGKEFSFNPIGTYDILSIKALEASANISMDMGMRFTIGEGISSTNNAFIFESNDGSPVDFSVSGNLYVNDEFRIGDNGMKIVGSVDENGKGYDFIVI